MKRSRRSLEAARLSCRLHFVSRQLFMILFFCWNFVCSNQRQMICLIISKLLISVTCPDGASSIEVVELVEQRNWIPETKCSEFQTKITVQSMLHCQFCHEINLSEFSSFRPAAFRRAGWAWATPRSGTPSSYALVMQ